VRFIQGRFINNLKLKSVNLFEGGVLLRRAIQGFTVLEMGTISIH